MLLIQMPDLNLIFLLVEEHLKSKRIRNEAGVLVDPKNRGELYDKWQKKRKRRIVGLGTDEKDAQASVSMTKSTNVNQFAKAIRRREHEEAESSSARDEIKDEMKLRKDLKEKQKNKEKNTKGRKKLARKSKDDPVRCRNSFLMKRFDLRLYLTFVC